jgi:hypothetical protein
VAGTAGQQQQPGKISLPLLSDAHIEGTVVFYLLPAPHVRTLYSMQLQDLQQSRVLCWPGERREQSISTLFFISLLLW